MSNLIILRGPSCSGKSSVAKELQERSKEADKYALVEQDYLRRTVLNERDTPQSINPELILQVTRFALEHGYGVILEGIFAKEHYESMFAKLFEEHPEHNYAYYFNVSFEETLRRHASTEKVKEFGEREMREWYKEKDLLGVRGERVIPEDSKLEDTVTSILQENGMQ